MKDLIKLFTGNSIEVNRIAFLLEQNQIASMIRDNVESARVAGFGIDQNSVELYVSGSDIEKAREILNDLENEQ